MSILRCTAGIHTYDDAQYSTCPYCRKRRLFCPKIGLKIESRYVLDLKFYKSDRNELWLATDNKLNIKVVIKFPDSQNNNINKIKAIKSKNLVKIYKIGIDNSYPFIVMEYIEGIELIRLIRKNGLSINHKIIISNGVLSAIKEIHSKKMIHCDIKPENIIFDVIHKNAKIIDFDCLVNNKDKEINNICGTKYYISPELRELHDIDERSDIYSLGVTLYYLFSAIEPQYFTKHISQYGIPKNLCDINNNIPSEIGCIISKMIQYDKHDRPSNIQSIIDIFKNNIKSPDSITDISLILALTNKVDCTTDSGFNQLCHRDATQYYSGMYNSTKNPSTRIVQHSNSTPNLSQKSAYLGATTQLTPILKKNISNINIDNKSLESNSEGVIKFCFNEMPSTLGITGFINELTIVYSEIYKFLNVSKNHDSEISILPEYLLPRLEKAQFNSPGFFEFISSLNPLTILLEYISQKNTIDKDKKYNNILEAQEKMLSNMSKENLVIRERLTVYKDMGFSESEIKILLPKSCNLLL